MNRNPEPAAPEIAGFARDARGNSYLEYIIIVGVVVLLSMQAFAAFGTQVSGTIKGQALDTAKMGL